MADIRSGVGSSVEEPEGDPFFALSPDMLCIAGQDGYFKRLNRSWSRVLGFSNDELMAEPFMSFVHPDDREATARVCASAAEGAEITSFVNRYRCRDGTYRKLEWSGAFDSARERLFAIARDITALERGDERLRHVLNASRVSLFCARPHDFAVTFMSENIVALFGYTPKDFMDDPELWASRLHPDDAEAVLAEMSRVAELGRVEVEYRFRKADGEYAWVHDVCRFVKGEGDQEGEIFGTWQDITRRKQAEEMIRRQAAAISELSTPLIPINDDVLVMPLIGTMDTHRAKQVINTLLEGVSANRARVAILDITGVAVVDTQVANALVLAARAVRLLGAEVVLTGIRSEVAAMLVELQVELEGIVARGSLQAGIEYALRRGDKRADGFR